MLLLAVIVQQAPGEAAISLYENSRKRLNQTRGKGGEGKIETSALFYRMDSIDSHSVLSINGVNP